MKNHIQIDPNAPEVGYSGTATTDSDRNRMPKNVPTPEELADVKTLMAALEPFRAHNPTMPLQLAFTFLLVAADEGKAVSDYARAAGMTPGVMARNLLDLGDYNRRREPGLMLVQEQVDPMDRRIHRKVLTHKGRALVGAIHRALSRTKKVLAWIFLTGCSYSWLSAGLYSSAQGLL